MSKPEATYMFSLPFFIIPLVCRFWWMPLAIYVTILVGGLWILGVLKVYRNGLKGREG